MSSKYNGQKIVYYVIPSNDKGNFAWTKTSDKQTAEKLARTYFKEEKEGTNFRVDVFTGNAEVPHTHLDPIYTKN